eukprot:6200926-Pleurochrysis_carterae.AAC.2
MTSPHPFARNYNNPEAPFAPCCFTGLLRITAKFNRVRQEDILLLIQAAKAPDDHPAISQANSQRRIYEGSRRLPGPAAVHRSL